MAAEARMSRIHVWSGLVILGVFLAGAAAGAGILAWLRPAGFPLGPPPRSGWLPPPLHGLDLTPEQQARARAIADKYRPSMEAVVEETFPRMRAFQEQMDRELRGILTDGQRKQLDERRARMRAGPRPPGPPGFGPPPGDPHPPGPPGFGPPPGPPPPGPLPGGSPP